MRGFEVIKSLDIGKICSKTLKRRGQFDNLDYFSVIVRPPRIPDLVDVTWLKSQYP